jgi:glycosyltransferase involved in cell wall biosynthesis
MTSAPRRRLRIAQAIFSMHIGGAENTVAHLARGLDRNRVEVSVICTTDGGVLADELEAEGIQVLRIAPANRRLRYGIPYFLWRALRRLGADVVHTHSTPTLLHAGPVALVRALPPWLHTFHFGNYPLSNAREMKAERFFCRRADALVAVADAQRRSIVHHHGLADDAVTTIVNGVGANPHLGDPSVRARLRAEFGFTDADLVVGSIAVLTRQKGVSFFLQAIETLAASHPRLRFLIAGGGALEADLRAEAAARGIDHLVRFTGWRQDNLAILTALDIFVMASLWEAMPLALLEAMAAARPIVVTDVGDNRQVVDDGRCGVVVPSGDPAALAAAIRGVVDDLPAAAAMGQRAQARYRGRFTRQHMLDAYLALYERLGARVAGGR